MTEEILQVYIEELRKLTSDHERRIRALERIVGYGSGAIGMAMFFLKVAKVI